MATTTPTTTGGAVEGRWRGVYTYRNDGVGPFEMVFVDCATQKPYRLIHADIPSYCRDLGEGLFVHVAGVLHPDDDDEDLLDEIEVTAFLEGPCAAGSCAIGPAWSGCGSWVDTCTCDPLAQNCPDGEKCSPSGSDLACVPVLPGAVGTGQPCTFQGDPLDGVDTCAKGHVCWPPWGDDSVCVPQCSGSWEAPECPACSRCHINGDLVLTLCLPACSALLQDCPELTVCVPAAFDPTSFACAVDASGDEGQVFDACDGISACDPGLWCAPPSHASECDPQAPGCCLPFCDLTAPSCPGAGQVCAPWYDPDDPSTCDSHLGHCRLP